MKEKEGERGRPRGQSAEREDVSACVCAKESVGDQKREEWREREREKIQLTHSGLCFESQ